MGLVIVLLSLTRLATPVFAVGPQKANGNPNLSTKESVSGIPVTEVILPSGNTMYWINTGTPHIPGLFVNFSRYIPFFEISLIWFFCCLFPKDRSVLMLGTLARFRIVVRLFICPNFLNKGARGTAI
jgi:hypothetical protein